jgi:hypothetical protein
VAEAAGKWSRLAALSGWQWWIILSAPAVLTLVWSRLRTSGYRRTLAAIQPVGAGSSSDAEQLALARDTAYALAVAIKYGPWRPRCLLRSLVLGWYLGRQGIPFELRLGVPAASAGGAERRAVDFNAHAWVEHAGVVLNDRKDVAEEFSAFRGREADAGRSELACDK